MERYLFEFLILVLFALGIFTSSSRLTRTDIGKRMDGQKNSSRGNQRTFESEGGFNDDFPLQPGKPARNSLHRKKFDSGVMYNDDTSVQPGKVGNNSNPKVETISTIIDETLKEATDKKPENETLSPVVAMKMKPKIPPHQISSIVNETVFKVMNNVSRDDPSAASAADKDEGSGSGSGSGYISCEMCPSCVGCVVMPMAPAPPTGVVHVNQFEGNPCLHGGELQEFPNGTFLCMCPVGFKGERCGELLYCHSNPCHNNGTCIEDANGFKCVCPKGFRGYLCEEFTSCDPNPCENDGVCIQIDSNFTCACKPGYQGERCKDTDPCFINPCLHGGSCTAIKGKANCSCTGQYGGDYCQVEKICYANPCHNGATCVENPTRPCICVKGYIGRLCSEEVCRTNPCLNGGACEVVQATAGNDKWTYKCTCPVFFQGKNCEVPNFCKGNPCKNQGTCVDLYRQSVLSKRWMNLMHQHPYYKCICPAGFTGKQCETDVCDSCHDHAVCVDHRCVCNSGYTGDGFDCTRIASPCHPNPCRNGATCSIGPDLSYDCECPHGYCGEHCQLICDICALKPCMNGGSCYARGDSRFCVCPPQYTGPDCNIRLPDLCQPNPCMHNFPCKYLKEKHDYLCDCKGKYSGKNCQNCDCPKGVSVDGEKAYDSYCDAEGDCVCPVVNGVALAFDEKKGCVQGKTEELCEPNPCLNGGTCFIKDGAREEHCVCKPPYYGERCEYKFCDVAKPCQNGGTCIDIGVKDYKCRCRPEFTGVNCTEPAPEPVVETLCSPSPCLYGGTCKERGNGYDCICPIRYTGPNCEVDRCSDCDINSDCVDGHCRCRLGYIGTGYVCEIDDSECGGVVCSTDNQQCVSGQCVCIPGTTCIAQK